MKIIFAIGFMFLCSCTGFYKPLNYARGFQDFAPEGTPTFRMGWRDGCQTGFKVSGDTHYKWINSFAFKPDFIEDDAYNEAWHMAFNHCRFYIASWQRRAS